MASFLKNMRRRKLYQQWVENSGLPPEDIPKNINKTADAGEEPWPAGDIDTRQYADSFLLRIRIRYILILGFIFALLLIAISVLGTILVMQSC